MPESTSPPDQPKFVCDEPVRTRSCSICGKPFDLGPKRVGRYATECSQPCRDERRLRHEQRYRFEGRYVERERARYQKRSYQRTCCVCSIQFLTRWNGGKCCSPACTLLRQRGERFRYAAAERAANRSVACPECAAHFFKGGPKDRFCSLKCTRRARDRIFGARRRGRYVEGEKVDPIKVFERDGWRCRECRCSTPRSLRGSTESRAPELDHIVSVADGGEHSYANTQLLCRACNGRKGRASRGQLVLI